MKESELQAKMIKLLESKGFYVRKIITANKNGTPDLLCCRPSDGKFIGIEVKAPGKKNKITKLQHYNLSEIERCNGISMLADNLDDLKDILN